MTDPHPSAVDLRGSTMGDVSMRDAVGRDVHSSVAGLTGDEVRRILADQRGVTEQLIGLVGHISQQMGEDSRQRAERQRRADVMADRVNLRLARIEAAILVLGLMWIVGFIGVAWLLLDRYAALSILRIAAGMGGALTLWRVWH